VGGDRLHTQPRSVHPRSRLAQAAILAGFVDFGAAGAVADPQRALDGFRVTFCVTAALALAGSIAALFIRDRDAAATMAASN